MYAEITQTFHPPPLLSSTHFTKSHDTKTMMYAFGHPSPYLIAHILYGYPLIDLTWGN